MTTYNWTALIDGQNIVFDPLVDVLNFNDAGIQAAAVTVVLGGTTSLTLSYPGKTVTLLMNPLSATQTNIVFADGSKLLIGDDATGTANDDAANTLTGGAGDDRLVGLGGNDTLDGGGGNDIASYSASSAGYSFSLVGGNFVITDTNTGNGDEGADTLIGVENASFTDGTISLVSSGENRVNTTTAGSQGDQAIAVLADGGFVVTWLSDGQDGDGSGVYARRFNASGVAIGGEFQVNTATANDQFAPAIAALSDGGFVVTWSSLNQDGSDSGVYAQRYDADGAAQDGEFRVNTTTAGFQGFPAIAALSGGGFVVTWHAEDGSGFGVYAQRYNASGTALDGEFRVNTATASSQHTSSVAALSGGGFVVTWESEVQDGGGYGVYAQRYDASGAAVGSEFRVNTTTASDQLASAITALADGGFAVTWMSNLQDGDGAGIYARRYDASGVAIGGEFQINTATANDQVSPAITALSDGGFVVTWGSLNQDGDGYGVYAQRYDASGTAAGSEFQVNTTTVGNQGVSSVAALADGGFVVTWSGNGVGDDVGTYAQRYDAAGNPVSAQLTGDGGNNVITWSGAGNVVLDGGSGSDSLTGGTGNDYLVGRTGFDSLAGGQGDDAYVNDGQDIITEGASAGTDLVRSDFSYTLGANLENLTLTGTGAINGTGNTLNNHLTGNSAANVLEGGAGNDTLNGLGGFDIATYSNATSGVTVSLATTGAQNTVGAGTDTLANIEALTGSALADTLTGNASNNVFTGLAGNDTLNGGGGTDIAAYGGGSSGYNFRLTSGNIVVTDIDASNGNDGIDRLISVESASFTDGTIGIDLFGELRVNSFTSGDQSFPAVAALTGGGFVVAWQSDGQDGSNTGIYAQRFDGDGVAAGAEFSVNSHTDLQQASPAITALSDGGFVVTWHSNGQDTSAFGVYAQRYDADGAAVDAEFRVNTTTTNSQLTSAVAALADGGFVVTWQSDNQDGSLYGIYARRYDSDGVGGTEFGVNTSTAGSQDTPDVAALSDGGFVVTWHSDGQDGDAYGVYARRYDVDDVAGAEFRVNTTTASSQDTPDVAALSDGGFVVTWESFNQDGSSYGIYAQRYDAAGATVDAEFRVNTFTANSQSSPAVAALSDGGFVVTWESLNQDGGNYGIYAQRYDAAGATADAEFRVNTFTANGQSSPAVAALSDGGFVVTWQSNLQDGDGYGIYAQRYDADGNAISAAFTGDGGDNVISWFGAGNLELEGGAGNDSLIGGSGNDFLTGGSGIDTLEGRTGDDLYFYDGQDIIVEGASAGTDRVESGFSYSLTVSVENLTLTGSNAINGTGNSSNNVLTGNSAANILDGGSGNDVFIGGGGADTYVGGTGNDLFYVDSSDDVVTELSSQGTDTVQSSASYSLSSDIENLVLTNGAANGAGNALNNVLTGNGADNGLSGGAGNDTLNGAAGDDTATYGSSSAGYDFRLTGGNIVVTDTDTVTGGNDGADTLLSVENTAFANGTIKVGSLGEFRVNTFTTGDQSVPSVATLADGGFVVAWQSNGQDGSGFGVYAQRYDAGGTPSGSEFRVNSATADHQGDAVVAALADGGFVVAWDSSNQDGDEGGVYAQRYDAGGAAAGVEILVNTTTDSSQAFPAVAALSGGGFVVVWSSFDQDETGSTGIYAQRYDADGDEVGGELQVNTTTSGDQVFPAVAALPDDGFVVVWESDAQDGDGHGVFAQRFNGNGSTAGDEFQVNTTTTDWQFSPEVAARPDGSFVVTWSSNLQDGGGNGVYAQRYDANGAPEGGEFRVNSSTSNDQYSSSVVILADGGFLVTWHSDLQDGNSFGVYARRYDAAGAAAGGEFQVNTTTAGFQAWPDIAATADGGFVATWHSQGQDGNGTGIYAQRFDVAGNRVSAQLTGDGGDNVIAWTGAGNVMLEGGAGNDTLAGGSGNDFLSGGAGADSMAGGTGNDTYVFEGQDTIAEGASAGIDLVKSGVTYTLAADFENLTLTGSGTVNGTGNTLDNVLTGNSAANTLDGGAGNDSLVGGGGADAFTGGAGDDLFHVDSADDAVSENPSEGLDTVLSSVGHTLAGNVENLMLIGGGAIDGAGNALDNLLTGNSGNNVLTGGAGNDTLEGGAGEDSASFDGSSAGYRFSFSGGNIVVTDTDAGNGDSGADLLLGVENASFEDGTIELASLGELRVNTAGAVDQSSNVAIATLADGGYIVTWNALVQDGSYDVHAKRFDADGAAPGGEFRVNTSTFGNQSLPAIAVLSGGDFVVTWNSDGQDGSSAGVYAQRFSAGGTALGAEFQVNEITADTQGYPAVSALSDGGFVVTWQSRLQDGNGYGVYARLYDAGGSAGSEFQVNVTTAFNQEAPVVAALPGGGFVVAWQSENQDLSLYGIYARLYDEFGAELSGEIPVNSYTDSHQFYPAIAALSGGGFIVTWQSYLQDGDGNGVYAQRFDASGEKSGGEFRVNATTAGFQDYSAVTELAGGGLVVTWMHSEGSNYEIFARIYDASGAEVGDEFQVNTTSVGAQWFPAVTALADGGFVVAWQSMDQDFVSWSVMAQRYDASGNPLAAQLTGDGADNAIAWTGAGNVVLLGAAGNDTLEGGPGNDSIVGDAGTDTASYSGAAGGVTVDLSLDGPHASGAAGGDTLVSIENLSGGAYADHLAGDGGVNLIAGLGGDDTLVASVGADTLDGGDQSDTADFSALAGPVTADLVALTAGVITLVSIENLTGSGFSDSLSGNPGPNLLDGGGGNDTLTGGAGNDTYVVDSAGDVVVEGASNGTDQVSSSIDYSLGTNFENLLLIGTDSITGTGNSENNVVAGNSAANTLDGGAGNDTLTGGGGGDTFVIAAGNGVDLIADFSAGDLIDATGAAPLLPFASGDGSTVLANQVQVSASGGTTTLFIGLDGAAGAELSVRLTGTFAASEFRLEGNDIALNHAPVLTPSGALDTNFGSGGKVTTDFGGIQDIASGVAIQPDGKIVAAGVSQVSNYDFALARYNPDGSLDTTFDTDGKQTTAIVSAAADQADAIVLQPDGRIVLAGTSTGANADFALARYNLDGSLDATFDTDGKLATSIGGGADQAFAMALQPDGKIVVAGMSSAATDDFALARYNPNGSLDTSFDGDGKLTTDIAVFTQDVAFGVAIQADGKIVAVGSSMLGGRNFALARYNPNGSLDTTFDTDGKLATDFLGGDDEAFAVALQADGKIVVAGSGHNGADTDFALARYNTNGTLDATFDGDGKVTTAIGTGADVAYSIALQPDGKIVVAGGAQSDGVFYDFALARYNADGSLDAGFDGDGILTVAFSAQGDIAASLALQADGGIVAAGSSWNGASEVFALVRVMPGGVPDQTASEDAAFSLTFASNLITDADGDAITYTATEEDGSPLTWLSLDSGTRSFTGTPANGDVGDLDVKLTATDGSNASVSDVFRIAVANTNDAPARDNEIADQDATEDSPFSFVVPLDTFGDVDAGDTLTWSATKSDGTPLATTWLAFTPGTRSFSGTPDNGEVGELEVKVTVTDGSSATAFDIFRITVANTNDAPTVAPGAIAAQIPDNTPQINNLFNFTFATDTFGDDDVGDTLTYAATKSDGSGLPIWLDFNDGTRTFSGTPLVGDIGPLVVKVTATDGPGASVSDSFTLTVGTDNDSISGDEFNNTLDGGTGADTMTGLQGDDTYIVDDVGDVVVEGISPGTDLVEASVSYTLPNNVEYLVLTGDSAIDGTGNIHINQIYGNDAANRLDGQGNIDFLHGGLGNDTYVVDNDDDVIDEDDNAGLDSAEASVSYELLDDDVENLLLTGTASIDATGNAAANTLIGNDGHNELAGGDGNDTLVGGAGNDTLDGGPGVDSMLGGPDDDTYIVDNVLDVVVEDSLQGADHVKSSVSWTLGANFEHLTLTGGDSIDGTGNGQSNQLIGNSGNNLLTGLAGDDLLEGKQGADTMVGGTGNDLYYVDNAGDVVTELASQGTADQIYTSVNITLPDHVESVTFVDVNAFFIVGNGLNNFFQGADGDDSIDGAAGDDTLVGEGGDDTIVGGEGNDVLDGGVGDNIVLGDLGADVALLDGTLADYAVSILSPGSGGQTFYDPGFGLQPGDIVNLVNQSGRIDRLVGVEKVRFLGDPDTDADDDEFDLSPQDLLASAEVNFGENYIADSNGTGSLLGGAGNDVLDGLDGDDTLEGASGNDVLLGGEGNDSLVGGEGNDALNGQAGDDTLVGGAGNDNYIVDSAGDQIVEAPGEGSTDRVQTVLTLYSLEALPEVEILEFVGAGGFHGVGNSQANVLIGRSGGDLLEAGAGNDSLIGTGGNDTLAGGGGNDTLDGGTGSDLVVLVEDRDAYAIEDLPVGVRITDLGSGETDLLLNVERVRFGDGAQGNISADGVLTNFPSNLSDTVNGGEDDDVIDALGGNDRVFGNGGNDSLTGGAGNDSLAGNAGNDTLDGGLGKDTLVGGAGDDTYLVDQAGETVTEGANAGTDKVFSAVAYTLGANLENLELLDGAGNLNGTGNGLNNTLTGNDGNNVLSGGLGNDLYVASAGNDLYVLSEAGDSIDASGGDAGLDTVRVAMASGTPGTYLDLTAEGWLEHVTYTGAGAVTLTGNDAGNALTGNAGNDTLVGGVGNDTLDGGAGNDSMDGGSGNDTYVVNAPGDQVIEAGGDADDALLINRNVDLNLAPFTEIEHVTLTGTAALNATGDGGDNALTGNSGANSLSGGAGADTLFGGAGNDTLAGGADDDLMDGGAGNDVYDLDSAGDIAGETMAAGGGSDLVRSWVDATLGSNLERLTLLGSALSGTGNALNNTLTGNPGNNTLDGGAGADTMAGGLGNDLYYVNQAGETVSEALNAGSDTVRSSVSYVLGANLEDLELTGSANVNATGNSLANRIAGNEGDNVLSGAAGNDTLQGGEGRDTYVLDNAADMVIEQASQGADTVQVGYALTFAPTLTAGTTWANVESIVVTGTGVVHLMGDGEANRLVGNASNNSLTGGAGDDTLDGGAGNDSMDGGSGNDTYVVNAAGDVVTEAGGDSGDTIVINRTVDLNSLIEFTEIEHVTLSGIAALKATGDEKANALTGNTGANSLSGGAGADTLLGGAGNDTLVGGADDDLMDGGAGNDLYELDSVGDVAGETMAAGGGSDLVRSWVDATLGANLERLVLLGGADLAGTGNGLANTLTGNPGNNTLDGGAGADTMAGGLGNDLYYVDQAGETVTEALNAGVDTVQLSANVNYALGANVENLVMLGSGNTTITGNGLANQIAGGAGNNRLLGGVGNDTLAGGAGNDTLTGGAGADQFVFDSPGGVDSVSDFAIGVDRLVFDNAVFTEIGGEGALAASALRQGAGATQGADADDRLVLDTATGNLYYDADGSDAGVSVQVAQLAGISAIAASDIVVI